MSAKPLNKPPADVPTDFGKHLRACMRCKLLKTFEQVRAPASSASARSCGCSCSLCAARGVRVRRALQTRSAVLTLALALALPAALRVRPTQFYDKGCENCPKLDMEGNRPRIEECTTTHFNGCALRCAARLLALQALRRAAHRSASGTGQRAWARGAAAAAPMRSREASAWHACFATHAQLCNARSAGPFPCSTLQAAGPPSGCA